MNLNVYRPFKEYVLAAYTNKTAISFCMEHDFRETPRNDAIIAYTAHGIKYVNYTSNTRVANNKCQHIAMANTNYIQLPHYVLSGKCISHENNTIEKVGLDSLAI